jgi:YHS domain-containing protein
LNVVTGSWTIEKSSEKEHRMNKNFRLWAVLAAVALLGAYAAGQAPADTAKDPVCGMSVKTAGNTLTAEYQGKTYYFCSADCKAAFLKDPAKFAGAKAPGTPVPESKTCCAMCGRACCRMAAAMPMPCQPPVPPAPGAPPVTPAAPQAVPAPGAPMPDCPMMKNMDVPACPKMAMKYGRMMRMHGHGGPMRPGMMGGMMSGGCPLCAGLAGKADVKVEKTADGVVVRISSKDPETIKMIQEHAAAMKEAAASAPCPQAPKAEEKEKK